MYPHCWNFYSNHVQRLWCNRVLQSKKIFTGISTRPWPLKSAGRARVLAPAHCQTQCVTAWQFYIVFLYLLSSIINQESLIQWKNLKPTYLHGAAAWFALRGQFLTNRSFCWQNHSQGELCNAEKHFSVWNWAVQPLWHSDPQWRSPKPWRMSKIVQDIKPNPVSPFYPYASIRNRPNSNFP